MYGSRLTFLAWVVGIFICSVAVYSVLKIYIKPYIFYRGKNETKARLFKGFLVNSAIEILFVLFIVGCIIFVAIYGIEPADLYVPTG